MAIKKKDTFKVSDVCYSNNNYFYPTVYYFVIEYEKKSEIEKKIKELIKEHTGCEVAKLTIKKD